MINRNKANSCQFTFYVLYQTLKIYKVNKIMGKLLNKKR